MQLKHITLLTSLFFLSAHTAPTPAALPTAFAPANPLPNQQGCTAVDNGIFSTYATNIGLPFDQFVCSKIFGGLNDNCPGLDGFVCVQNGFVNQINLQWDCLNGHGAGINRALEFQFPTIEGGFSCPDH